MPVNGVGSHSHKGRTLVQFRWTHLNSGRTSDKVNIDCQHEIGVHGYKLDVLDSQGGIAGDFLSFTVAPSTNIPGTRACHRGDAHVRAVPPQCSCRHSQ